MILILIMNPTQTLELVGVSNVNLKRVKVNQSDYNNNVDLINQSNNPKRKTNRYGKQQ